MSATEERISVDLDDLSIDVFELVDSGLAADSLTTGHGMLEMAASVPACTSCCTSSSCSA